MTPNEHLNQWLQANGYGIQILVMAPKGGFVSVDNYLPDGWKLDMQVMKLKKEPQADGQTDTSYPGDRVPDLAVAAQQPA